MKPEQYIKAIARKVKCSNKKRKEITQQLESDFQAALDHGETPEQIMERMGSVKEVAEEFNQNLPNSEKREFTGKHKRTAIITTILIIGLCIALGYRLLPRSSEMGSSGMFEADAVEERAKQVVQMLNNGEFDDLQDMAIDSMKSTLTQEVMDQAKEQISDEDWGDFLSIGKIYMAEVKQSDQLFAVTEMTVSYENTAITYRISFDTDMKLAGLYLK